MPSSTSRRRGLIALGTALATLAVPLSGAYADGPAAAGPPAAAARAAATTDTHTVTLITGDRVTVKTLADGHRVASVDRPKKAVGGVRTQTVGKDLYVFPDGALPYLAAGVLDQRLFDVTRLIADGYDDAHTASLPVIVQYGGAGAARQAAGPLTGLTTRRSLPAISGAAASAGRARATRLWQDLTPAGSLTRAKARSAAVNAPEGQARPRAAAGPAVFGGNIGRIWLDGKVKATLAESTAQIGAPDVWRAGTDGTGVNVAVLDSGADTGHPDFAGQIASSQSFVPGEDVTDRHGHGTHTASTVAGTGAASGGKEKGVAPGARLLVGKVLGDDGFGDESWIIAGMEWAARTEHAKVISMSLGTSEASDGTDPMSQAVDDLSAATGALFVVAAGNSGAGGIGAPGAATAALTVGAVDADDALASFSSWGPRQSDGALKPEVTAPGVDILAARSQYAAGSGSYVRMSGTSMATPHVAGAAALVAQRHPDWTGGQIKDALVSTAHATPDIPVTQGGTGRLDARTAVLGTIHAEATAWSGFYAWPHTDDRPSARTVTYTNTGDQDVGLDLAAAAKDANGAAVPAGVFTLSAPAVTVPAHGTAAVTLTGDPNAAPYGATAGLLSATDAHGTAVAHTLIGLDREDERYDLTIRATDRAGRPLSGVAALYRTGDAIPTQVQIPDDGVLTLRRPKGEYSLLMYADLPGAAGPDDMGLAVLSAPQITLDRDRTARLDARQAHRVSAVAPQATEDRMTRIDWNRVAGGVRFNANYLVPLTYTSVWAQQTDRVTSGSLNFAARWRKAAPLLTVEATGPYPGERGFPDLVVQAGSTLRPAGSSRLGVVHAGLGRTADYAGLDAKGKAVVVRYDRQADPRDQPKADAAQAAAAVAAGAGLLLVVNDTTGRLSDWYGAADGETKSPIEVASLQPHEGAALIAAAARPGLRLAVTSRPASPYVYDLVERHDGAVPATGLTYRPARSALARLDSRFAGQAGTTGDNARYDMQDFDIYGFGYGTEQALAATRTDWVTPGDGAFTWYEESGTATLEERSLRTDPKKGSRTGSDWFLPVVHPRLNPSQSLPGRQGDFLVLNVPGWGDGGAGHNGFDRNLWEANDPLHETVTLYQGDTELGSTAYQQLTATAPSGAPLPYRLVAETSQDGVFPTSTQTRTEWTFTSGNGWALIPLIQLDHGVATDLSGNAARHTALTLTASQLPGVTGAGRIDVATLQLSYDDGAHWTPAALRATADGSWATTVTAPRTARYVSLRATARDTAGNTVSQTVVRAYGLN
ncbi:S8 family serine peptidase [Streptomyces celluloflavus]|uniref:S8 family serine peptidase n=1 Tax=Streptomyces celluloflavus TaxID=58344 RepID=UPI0036B4AD94